MNSLSSSHFLGIAIIKKEFHKGSVILSLEGALELGEIEELLVAIKQGQRLFQAESNDLEAIEQFQGIYDTLLDLEYTGLIRITGRRKEIVDGHRLMNHISVRLIEAA